MPAENHDPDCDEPVEGAAAAPGDASGAEDDEDEPGTGRRRELDDFDDEEEDEDATATRVKPWDPRKIRVATRAYSLRQVVDDVRDGSIDLAPDFQRDFVWRERQKTLLIESVLLGIPLPAFYFNANEDNTVQVVDGVQRLSTIRDFEGGLFALSSHLEYLKDLQMLRFSQLEAALRRRFNQTQIVVHVIEPTTPPDVKYDIFKRINTGGSPLTPQEIRHCIGRQRSRAFLRRLVSLPEFKHAMPHGAAVRMRDRELALRFIAFYRLCRMDPSLAAYERYETLDAFLLRVTQDLDDPRVISDAALDALAVSLTHGLRNARKIFGRHAFRKWSTDSERRRPFNKSLFESWTSVLADVSSEIVENNGASIRKAAREAMTTNQEYLNAVTYSTGEKNHVQCRFKLCQRIVETSL